MNNAVYIRLTPGLANQLYEYMAGYALAKKLNRELILDISLCWESQNTYLLDMLCIPEHKKIWYPLDAENRSHPNVESIPEHLRECSIIFSDMEIKCDNYYHYKGLNYLPSNDKLENNDIFMCGYFFPKEFYAEYWEELCGFCKLRKDTEQISLFRKQIEGKETVGIHIRRGDFLMSDMSAYVSADDFWRAAVVWFRKKYHNCIFCVFSDDIEYAKETLGNAQDVNYVHFGNSDGAAITEFLCLSMCKHKIQSNGSTFSILADEINYQAGRIVMRMDQDYKSYPWMLKVKLAIRKICLKYEKNNTRGREIKLNDADIRRLCKEYRNTESGKALEQVFGKQWELEDFLAFVDKKRYDLALDLAYCNYEKWKHDKEFRSQLVETLLNTGNPEEAIVETVSSKSSIEINPDLYHMLLCKECIHFVIVPYYKSRASARISELLQLGIVLSHLGHKVSLVLEPIDDSEEMYMRSNQELTTRISVPLGLMQYVWQDVMEEGIEKFLSRISCQGEQMVVVARRTQFLKQQYAPVIFPDYSYTFDAEKPKGIEDSLSREKLSKEADYILTCDMQLAGNKIIHYYPELWEANNKEKGEETEVLLDKQHRMSVRHIYMAAVMIDKLKNVDYTNVGKTEN